MQFKVGNVREYKRRHDSIWPELIVLLSNACMRDYSIFIVLNYAFRQSHQAF
ncbi:L-rhamnose mutarotase [Glaciimonas sp. CA11.2]|nr:L-rhamnose mutarotase [Glaciimonas sp. CA11.2]MEB0013735.1 L-rhamnose mutarotase [Glaciimonas sp. Cout2]MEB0083340.1 L-rhamnose mutarotase [Glaciimonas sp. Gout2]MEB0163876.1 L-rhamnose mutarotase [Glaciimonas sp. CA11.2]